MLLWLWVHCNQCQVQCNKQVEGAKTTLVGVRPRQAKVSPNLPFGLGSTGELAHAALFPGLCWHPWCTHKEVRIQPHCSMEESRCLPNGDRRNLVGKETFCFQVLRGYDNKSRLGLFISPLSCLLSPAKAISYIRHVWKTRVNVDFSTSNYILETRRLLSV